MEDPAPEENPLLGSANDWERMIEAIGPPALIVRIETRMSATLMRRVTAKDLWQETLLHAWRDRAGHRWQGLSAFRRWILQIAENRIRDAADRELADKRGAGRESVLSSLAPDACGSSKPDEGLAGLDSSTPSRHAMRSEEAECMREALQALPDEVREVVRLRLFEEWEFERIAAQLGLSVPTVKHRLRKGAARYRERLTYALGSRGSHPKP